MSYKIAVLPGDGIGAEVVTETIKVLHAVEKKYSIGFEFQEAPAGGAALDAVNEPLPADTLALCKAADAVLLGAVGGPKWDDYPPDLRPEQALLGLRRELGVYVNLRPARVYSALVNASTLKPDLVRDLDLLVVRELTGGIYFGKPAGTEATDDGERGFSTMVYTTPEVERIARRAFELARLRQRRLTSVDKANILPVSQLWRKVVTQVASDYPDVELTHMYVDNAAMQLVRYPKQFDVIVTGNMFGDILSDEAAMLTGSIGMLPSASLGDGAAVYEPVHGSAPDIVGQNKANPLAAIASAAMMLRYSFELSEPAAAIEDAIQSVLDSGYRTPDILDEGGTLIGTTEMSDHIVSRILDN